MFLSSNSTDFPAILRSDDGELLAEGRASVSKVDRWVTFASDFVPLYPVGTPMKIIRIHEKNEIHRFSGTVYISDKQLMRLVSIRDELYPGAEKAYCCGFTFPAKLTPQPIRSRLVQQLFQRGKRAVEPIDISICALTDQQLEFQFPAAIPLEVGQEFLLEATPHLPIPATSICVKNAMRFGPNAAYLCDFTTLEVADRERLHDFLVNYTWEHEKLF